MSLPVESVESDDEPDLLAPPAELIGDRDALISRFRLSVRIRMTQVLKRFFIASGVVGLIATMLESLWLFWLWLPYTAYVITCLYFAASTLSARAEAYANRYASDSLVLKTHEPTPSNKESSAV